MIKKKFTCISMIIWLLFLLCGCQNQNMQIAALEPSDGRGNLSVYFIDVGQGDASLIEYNNHFMLIDAGENDDETFIVDFLKEKQVKSIDYLIATHPHADHIGGMDAVIKNFDIQNIYMPKAIETTKTFEDVLTEIEKKNLKITAPIAGDNIYLDNIPIQILAPLKNYEDMNNNSIVLRLSYQNISCLFTGDMEVDAEGDVLSKNKNIKSTVLKVAHHGSDSSSTQPFIDAVNPAYAVLSVGKDNSYGHPTEVVLNRLADKNSKVYRTDAQGTIKLSTDGTRINIGSQKNDTVFNANVAESQETLSISYIGNKNTKKFHLESCNTLPSQQNRIEFKTKEEALAASFIPCKNCIGN